MSGLSLAILAAALPVFFGGIGSCIGIGKVGRAANALLSREPQKFGSLLILEALPGTQGIYGFLAGFFVIMKIGLLGGKVPEIPFDVGVQILLAVLPITFVALTSAIFQGMVARSGVEVVAKQEKEFMKPVIFAAMVETYAILGLLASIIFINGISVGK